MNYTTEIYAAHQDLSDCSVAFLEFVKKNPACLDRANFDGILIDKRFPDCNPQPWPTFVSNKKKMEMAEAAQKINDLIKSIIPRFFSYDIQKICHYYEIDPERTQMLMYGVDESHLKNLLARGDFIATPSGEFKCLEFNMQANLGGWELDLLEPIYTETPIIANFLKEYSPTIYKNHFFSLLFEHVLDAFQKKHPDTTKRGEIEKVNMAIVYPDPFLSEQNDTISQMQNSYKQALHKKNSKLKGELIVCGFNSLKMSHNFLVHDGQKIDILLEMLNGLTPLLYMHLVKEGNLQLYNGPVCKLMSNKLNLAFLSEHQDSDIFSLEEQAVIKKHIPWTRKVLASHTSFLLSQQENLVLKPSDGLGGIDVFLGCKTAPAEWAQQVEKAVAEKKWVAQEYVPSASYLYQNGKTGCSPHHVIWGLFVMGSQYAGGFVRIMPENKIHGAINYHQGAEESIIIEVEES